MSSSDTVQKFGLVRFWDISYRKLFVSRKLRFGINSSLEVVQSDGTQHSVSAAQVANQIIPDSTVQTLAAATTLTAEDSGKTLVLSAATEFAVTLPAPANGLKFKFVIGAAPSGASYTVATSGGSNVIEGLAVVNGATVAAVNEDTITFTDGAAAVGGWVDLVSNGTSWFVSGQAAAATGVAFSAT